MLSTKTRYARQFIFSNVRGVISRNLLPHIDSITNFLNPLIALNFIVSISMSFNGNFLQLCQPARNKFVLLHRRYTVATKQ